MTTTATQLIPPGGEEREYISYISPIGRRRTGVHIYVGVVRVTCPNIIIHNRKNTDNKLARNSSSQFWGEKVAGVVLSSAGLVISQQCISRGGLADLDASPFHHFWGPNVIVPSIFYSPQFLLLKYCLDGGGWSQDYQEYGTVFSFIMSKVQKQTISQIHIGISFFLYVRVSMYTN